MADMLEALRKQLRPKHDNKAIEQFLRTLQKKLAGARVVAGGSYAKGTSIKGLHDIDVFVKFPKDSLALSEQIAKALPKLERLHGSRDYFQVKHQGYVFELVPVLDIMDWREAENITDMSPLHVAYVQTKLNQRMKDDVRLAKQFCKAAGVYGAESYIRGFSGHVLEMLILTYRNFEALLKATAGWKAQIVLDPEKHYVSPEAALLRLNEAKTQSPLIIIDPVQPDRNAAAALSREAFETLKERAAAFLKKPSKAFFDIKVNKLAIKKQWKAKVLFVTANSPKGKPDVVGCKMRDRHDKAIQLFKESGFSLVHADWRFDKQCIAWYVLKETRVPELTEHQGPPSKMHQAVAAFREKHETAYERSGRWYAKVKRKYTTGQQVLNAAWKQ